LLSRIAEHDIGLALEATVPSSRDLTITNKILQYLLGGLAVVATHTSGQAEVSRVAPDSVRLVDQTSDDLRSALATMISDTDLLIRARTAAISSVKNDLSWEIQSERLLSLVERSLTTR
jgi:glycosyltransferase involved in cell wall biosynthesis